MLNEGIKLASQYGFEMDPTIDNETELNLSSGLTQWIKKWKCIFDNPMAKARGISLISIVRRGEPIPVEYMPQTSGKEETLHKSR